MSAGVIRHLLIREQTLLDLRSEYSVNSFSTLPLSPISSTETHPLSKLPNLDLFLIIRTIEYSLEIKTHQGSF